MDNNMPRIKVYKSGETMIPVDAASIANVYECPWTADLFSNKREYVTHLKKLRRRRMHGNARDIIKKKKLTDFRSQLDLDKLIDWIHVNPKFFFDRIYNERWQNREDLRGSEEDFELTVTSVDVRYYDIVSNSHHCPQDGVENWGGRETWDDGTTKPKGYPGFSGQIEFLVSHYMGWGSDIFKGTGLHTGTGGGSSSGKFSYDLKMFVDDFPNIKLALDEEKRKFEKDTLLSRITTERVPIFKKKYTYGTPSPCRG